MGGEFGQAEEWHHERTLDWHLWARAGHGGLARWLADLNGAYRTMPALHRRDFHADGFAWLPAEPNDGTVLGILRRGLEGDAPVAAFCNMTPQPLRLRVALPHAGDWHEFLNSDATFYGGSGCGNLGRIHAAPHALAGWPACATVTVPPLGTVMFTPSEPTPNSIQGEVHARQ
jgi:1,4-alpha-glucan branching enzyme